MSNYAFIKNNVVVNIAVFENPSEQLLNEFKTAYQLDDVVLVNSNKAEIGGIWNGTKFLLKKPFSSWVLNDQDEWVSPIPYPTDGELYSWNDSMIRWDLIN